MSDEFELPSERELEKLPWNSVAVYAIRCALRVQPLLVSWNNPTEKYKRAVVNINASFDILASDTSTTRAAIDAAYSVDLYVDATTTKAARNAALSSRDAAEAASSAAAAIRATPHSADAAARAARSAAAKASRSANDAMSFYLTSTPPSFYDITRATRADYVWLKEFRIKITEASETGPLGDLWHGSPPDWYLKEKAKYDKTIVEWEREIAEESPEDRAKRFENSDPEPLISVYFDDSDFTKEEMAAFLEYVSESYRSLGGEGLKVVDGKTLLPENTKVVL